MIEFDNFTKPLIDPLFHGSLPAWQAEPMRRIIAEGERRNRPIEDIAYVLATAYHETERWKYDEEIGHGAGRDYGAPILLIRGQSVAYYGRGFVQLTWLKNYAAMSVLLTLEHGRQIDLVSNPDLVKLPDHAALIIWEGMIRGIFTGKNLRDFIKPGENVDFVGARQIINGTDRAGLIAGYAKLFLAALDGAYYRNAAQPQPEPKRPPARALGGLLGGFKFTKPEKGGCVP